MPAQPAQPPAAKTMQCMEVWGGNGVSDNGVTMPGLDAWVVSVPFAGEAAGGDIHYVSSCGTGRISRIMVADVAGHGSTAADLAIKLRALMRRYVNYVDQSALCARMNREFAPLADAGRFATAVVATFWAPTRHLAISNAGHPRPFLYASASRSWTAVEHREAPGGAAGGGAAGGGAAGGGAALPLGILDDSEYGQFSVRLRRGDLLVMYTDSLTEARAEGGAMLREAGLLNILSALDPAHPETLARDLLAAVVSHCGGRPPEDDATIIVLSCNGLAVRAPLIDQFRAAASFAGMFAASLVGRGLSALPWPEACAVNLLGPFIPPLNRRWGARSRQTGD